MGVGLLAKLIFSSIFWFDIDLCLSFQFRFFTLTGPDNYFSLIRVVDALRCG